MNVEAVKAAEIPPGVAPITMQSKFDCIKSPISVLKWLSGGVYLLIFELRYHGL